MPERNYDALDGDDRQAIADYVPGYDWIPGRFGPPPGIPKQRKDEFDEEAPVVEEKLSVDQLGGYKFCVSLGYPAEAIKKAYAANNDAEFDEQSVLVKIVTDLKVNDTTSLDNYVKTLAKDRELPDTDSEHGDTTTVPGRRINVPDLIISPNEPSDQECKDFIHALKCKICRKQMAGAVALPCGCFCLCQHCSKEDLPKKCPACANPVNGACRIFLA